MNKLTKVDFKLVNKGNFNCDIVLPNGTIWALDDPLYYVLGMIFTCEFHMMKIWSWKLKIDLKEIKIKDVEGILHRTGLNDQNSKNFGFMDIKGTYEIISSASENDFWKLVETAQNTCPLYYTL